MDLGDVCNEFVKNHDEKEILDMCSKGIVDGFKTTLLALKEKKYELAGAMLGETLVYVDILEKLDTKMNGEKNTVVVV